MRWVLPIAVLVVGAIGAFLLLATRPRVEVEPHRERTPRVRVLIVTPRTVKLSVSTHGTVAPRTESQLIPEVSGPVVAVSESLVSGGFFEEGDVLLEIDPSDYETGVTRSRAALVRAESQHQKARKDLERRRGLFERGAASDAQVDDTVNAERLAGAAVTEARSTLEQAERDLARTRVRAPFAGRVRDEQVGVGQFVNRGTSVGTIYATDLVEVRLPIPDRQLALLELPLGRNGEAEGVQRPEVTLHAQFAGGEHTWHGVVQRTEGEIDPKTRMVNVVAQVESPYERARLEGRPPLAVGLFVRAEIQGREVDGVVVLPRSAVHKRDRVWIVDAAGRLRERTVQVLTSRKDEVVIAGGLEAGDQVVISPLDSAVEGMVVEPTRAPAEVRS